MLGIWLVAKQNEPAARNSAGTKSKAAQKTWSPRK
jgi:hypothetical protein